MIMRHDQDAHGAKWFGKNYVKQGRYAVYTVGRGARALRAQCLNPSTPINRWSFSRHEKINGYIIKWIYIIMSLMAWYWGSTTRQK